MSSQAIDQKDGNDRIFRSTSRELHSLGLWLYFDVIIVRENIWWN